MKSLLDNGLRLLHDFNLLPARNSIVADRLLSRAPSHARGVALAVTRFPFGTAESELRRGSGTVIGSLSPSLTRVNRSVQIPPPNRSSNSDSNEQREATELECSCSIHDRAREDTLHLIQSKQDMGIWSRDMKQETSLPDNVVAKSLKSLLSKGLIKKVVNVQFKGHDHFLASEFEPSPEISGGQWYNNQGSLDSGFIDFLKDQCLKHIRNLKIATVDMVTDAVQWPRVLKDDYSSQQIGDIVRALVLDNDVIEMRSNGLGEFASIPTGRMCYKCRRLPDAAKEPRVGAMASISCGVCPRIAHCMPDGIISPTTCEYYSKWLDF